MYPGGVCRRQALGPGGARRAAVSPVTGCSGGRGKLARGLFGVINDSDLIKIYARRVQIITYYVKSESLQDFRELASAPSPLPTVDAAGRGERSFMLEVERLLRLSIA